VISDETLLVFLAAIEADVTDLSQPYEGSVAEFRESACTQLYAEDLEGAGVVESPVVCHYESGRGNGACKINGYAVSEDESRLDLFITVYRQGPHATVPTLAAAECETAFNRARRFLGRALSGAGDTVDPALPQCSMMERVASLRGHLTRVQFVLFTNCRLAARGEKQRKDQCEGVAAAYDIWDIERLRRLREAGGTYEPISIDMSGDQYGGVRCVEAASQTLGYRTCVAIIPAELLRDIYAEHGPRLLELNVRSYLQAKGKINKGLLDTLRSQPDRFLAYNNGLTVVADSIETRRLNDGAIGIAKLVGMQIVNGGQTTASIYRAATEQRADLSRVSVLAKIVIVDASCSAEVVPAIARYANSQNKVTEPDLHATHPFHVGIERVAMREWTPGYASKWFYERARGSYQTARSREGNTEARRRDFDRRYPTSQRITKEDLAKVENCWRGLPHIVNRGGQKNFAEFMGRINKEHEFGAQEEAWEPSAVQFHEMIAKAILFREIQKIVRHDESITAYRINVSVYLMALLAARTEGKLDLGAIWRSQDIGAATRSTVTCWAPIIFEALLSYAQSQKVHIDNVLKSVDTWKHVSALDVPSSPSPDADMGSARKRGAQEKQVAGSSAQPIPSTSDEALCMSVSAEQWRKIEEWGRQSGKLKGLALGFAGAFERLSRNGWKKRPSAEQVRNGLALIRAAQAGGVLSSDA
jgi:hypothetical protein